ncbi:MAG: hypothetical protein Q8P59_12030 [Dehalococcoidia bacterium]|nr:hypothetical protein [Dehalococcoidia bacterium]
MVVTIDEKGYFFPPPPSPEVVEWEGSPIGIKNIITRTKGRTSVHDKTLDKDPTKREQLLERVRAYLKETGKPVCQQDVIIHGVRVRAVSNSEHLCDFWPKNWFDPEQWSRATGREAPQEPQIMVYALTGVPGEAEAAYYSRQLNTIVFFNTAYYGQLKSWVLGAAGRILAGEYGIHSIHGACVAKDQKGILYIAPTGTGKSTSSYGFMDLPETRFHSDDWVYIRYTLRTRDGRRVAPYLVESPEGPIRGYRVFRWLADHQDRADISLEALTLSDEKVRLKVGDLDWTAPLEAYAYISERIFYLRSNLVESFPRSMPALLASKFENVPDVTPQFLEAHQETLESLARSLDRHISLPANELKHLLARLYAFDNARAMLDMLDLFPPERVFTNPLEPVRLDVVILLRRDQKDSTVVRHLSLSQFMTNLMLGETPTGTRETAYNAYRAVDDKLERDFIEGVREESEETGCSFHQVYEDCRTCPPKPDTLEEEFDLFELLFKATRCYDLNTILTQDPDLKDKQEAVARTIDLLALIIRRLPQDLSLDLGNYRNFFRRQVYSRG